jgi:hypothetical protein
MQIDDLLKKMDDQKLDFERGLEEKDGEIEALQEGLDDTLRDLNATKIVSLSFCCCSSRLYGRVWLTLLRWPSRLIEHQ